MEPSPSPMVASLGKFAREERDCSLLILPSSLYGTPIINLPQTAVLGLHAIKEKPVAIAGKVEIRPIMVVALTYDHRLLDGKEAVTFLVKIKNYIEDPRRMLLGV